MHILSCPVQGYRLPSADSLPISADSLPMSADSLFLTLYLGCPVLLLDTWLGVQRSCQVLYPISGYYEGRQPICFSYSCWTFRVSCLVPGNWGMNADTLSACPFPVVISGVLYCTWKLSYECRHPVSLSYFWWFLCPVLYLEIELWVQTPCRLVIFLLNISGVLSCTWKLSFECRHPVCLSSFCWTFRGSCLVPGNWAISADTLSACPFRNATRSLS